MDEKVLEEIPRFSWANIKKHLAEKTPFEAISPMGTALIRIKSYQPLVGLALHGGHQVREEFQMKMAIEDLERRIEEGPATDDFITSFPIQMIALDSRYEYDLDRPREESVYLKPFQSWGKKVWRTPPTKDELEMSYQKYDEFHELFDFMVEQFTEMFGKIFCLDLHTYSPKRPTFVGKMGALPMFCVSSTDTDRKQFKEPIDYFISQLGKVNLPGGGSGVKENDPFKKDGALTTAFSTKFADSLFLPIEIKNIYLHDETGELDPAIVAPLTDLFGSLGSTCLDRWFAKSK